MADWGCLGIDVGVVLYMCVDRVTAAYIRFTLSRLKNIRFIVFVFNYDIGCSDFSLLVFCVDSVVGQGRAGTDNPPKSGGYGAFALPIHSLLCKFYAPNNHINFPSSHS